MQLTPVEILQLLASEKRLLDRLLAQIDDVVGSRKEDLLPLVSQDYGRLQHLLSLGVLTLFQGRWRLHPTWVVRLLSLQEQADVSAGKGETDSLIQSLQHLQREAKKLVSSTDGAELQATLSAFCELFNQSLQRSAVWFDEVQATDLAAELWMAWHTLQQNHLGKLWDWTPQLDRLLIALGESLTNWEEQLTMLEGAVNSASTTSLGEMLCEINEARRSGDEGIQRRMTQLLQEDTLSYWANHRTSLFWPRLDEISEQFRPKHIPDQAAFEPIFAPVPITPSLRSLEQGLLYRFVQDGYGQDLFSFLLEQPETSDLSLSDLQEWFGRMLLHAGDMVHVGDTFVKVAGIHIVEVRRIGEA